MQVPTAKPSGTGDGDGHAFGDMTGGVVIVPSEHEEVREPEVKVKPERGIQVQVEPDGIEPMQVPAEVPVGGVPGVQGLGAIPGIALKEPAVQVIVNDPFTKVYPVCAANAQEYVDCNVPGKHVPALQPMGGVGIVHGEGDMTGVAESEPNEQERINEPLPTLYPVSATYWHDCPDGSVLVQVPGNTCAGKPG